MSWLRQLFEATKICVCCEKEVAGNTSYPNGKHLDHIKPLSKGGKHVMSNVRYICAFCNNKKNAKYNEKDGEPMATPSSEAA